MVDPIHHYHRRKRIYKRHEPYPSSDKYKRFMDKMIYAIGIIGPLATIPQAWKIWTEKNASGLFLYSWIVFCIVNVTWLFYGILHREKPIIITYIGWLIVNIFVVMGIILYG